MGEAPESIILVETEEDVDRLEIADDAKVAYLTQTTLSVDDANRIIQRLRPGSRIWLIRPKKTFVTRLKIARRRSERSLRKLDLCFVLGSQNSSNSQRLRELAGDAGIPAHLIDGADDIDPDWLAGVETVLITAGPAHRKRSLINASNG